MTATTLSTDLPVPREALLELGLTEDQIAAAERSRPAVLACQAGEVIGARFDVDRVRRVLKALGQFRHTKGRWARDNLRLRLGEGLSPWQVVWVIAPIFGWVAFDDEVGSWVRVIRTAWIEIPRKNGKSTISSGLANVLLLADGETGAEVYAAAASKDQAKRVFDDAKRMCQTSPAARKRARVLAEVITVAHTGGVFRALSKLAEVAHGLNVHGAVVDEVHVYKRRDLVDAIETGTGAREQPLIIFITTADEGLEGSIYDEKHSYTRNVANNVVDDPTHYGVVWAADEKDDPYAETTWRKANPGLGVSPTLAYLRKEAKKAKTTPTYYPTFLRLHLNRRERGLSRPIDLNAWDNAIGLCDLDKLAGQSAWGGLDLSAVSDFTAWWLGVASKQPGVELEYFWRFWLPEDSIEKLTRQLQVPIQDWIDSGWITVTEGNVIDYTRVKDDVLADCRKVNIRRIGYDRMFAGQMVQDLDKELHGVEVVPVAQTFFGTSPAIKEQLRLLGKNPEAVKDAKDAKSRTEAKPRFLHGGNPVARWMASVVEAKNDGFDNLRLVKPDRAKAKARIDGMSATVNGLDGYVRRGKNNSGLTRVRGKVSSY